MGEMSENPIDYIWVSQVYHVYPDDSVEYQLSQRADHIIRTMASRVRFNRALINPKWEHFYAHEGMHRLHVLFGESNQNEWAYKLKIGATCLALQMLEDGVLDGVQDLEHPLVALRDVSRDGRYGWRVKMADGTETSALDIQYRHLELAQRYGGWTEDIDWTLSAWAEALDGLRSDPMAMGDRLDWVAKKQMVEAYREELGLESGADALHSVDLEYHNIDPAASLFHGLQEGGGTRRAVDELSVVEAMTDPPRDTRAYGRSALVRRAQQLSRREGYVVDWSGVVLGRKEYVEMPDPFNNYAEYVEPRA